MPVIKLLTSNIYDVILFRDGKQHKKDIETDKSKEEVKQPPKVEEKEVYMNNSVNCKFIYLWFIYNSNDVTQPSVDRPQNRVRLRGHVIRRCNY